mmetsp:Transcript_6485/g.18689  ORF Transcript_6485/g.18689 Transcript_6485/m.18689 type:complete len:248 (-) Transcript_6485:98-841(-)|eukprot:CAMPEP_0206149070 /NCGR_PEP_ID=MMETSP1473-20131121/37399_1 /ASSEMBLY_ACC=CAM_ASM_001109 /TAXON_ID=1461547 /ORGANISM="Stichococcus sp, Strain RCC1054" /LENGTH=247 /DNA_ID=CAMNT_0053546513 /DNA_START=88 /DNA_END=831 /DNA_ORIENTATION=+
MNIGGGSSDFARPSAYGAATPLSERLAQFKGKFQELLGRKHAGYDELNQGLMSGQDADDSRRGFGNSGGGYQGPVPGYEGGGPHSSAQSFGDDGTVGSLRSQHMSLPSQAEEMREVAALANEAGELLWEMVAQGAQGDATAEMKQKAQQLQAQLRGLIGDYQDSDEGALEAGLKSFDVLNNVLEEHSNPTPTEGFESGAPETVPASVPPRAAVASAPQSAAAPAAPHMPPKNLLDPVPADEKPLMEF